MTSERNANLYALLASRFAGHGERPAIQVPGGRCWSYAELEDESARIAGFLRGLGVAPGERVAVQVDKSPQALFLYLACLRAGLVYLPLNTAYPERELDYFLADAEPAVVVCRPESCELLERLAASRGVGHVLTLDGAGGGSLAAGARAAEPLAEVVACGGEECAAILYTSGTTGRPKGAMLSHANLAANALTLHRVWGFRPGDVLLHALPLFHTHGLFVACHCALLNASPMILLERFDPRAVIEQLPRATVMMGVPTFYTRLLAEPAFGAEPCRNMRLFISGSAPLLEQTFHEFRERTGHTILERYGMTEAGMVTSNPLDGERKPGTVGPPLPGVSLRVVDETGQPLPPGKVGAIEYRGPNVFKGYWRRPEKTAEEFTADGYFRSGDLGLIDEDGYVVIVGRSKDLVISGGYNVYPKEVEVVIDALEGVAESAVIGVPDPDLGERVTAVVVARPGAALSEEGIIAAVRPQLAGYKVPKRVHLVAELPRNAMGKVQKSELRERFG